MSDFDRQNRQYQEQQERIQQDIIRQQKLMEENHMKNMLEVQKQQQNMQNQINQQHINTSSNTWANANLTQNSTVPAMVWTPIDPNNSAHQAFLKK